MKKLVLATLCGIASAQAFSAEASEDRMHGNHQRTQSKTGHQCCQHCGTVFGWHIFRHQGITGNI
jgi:hypothetical protein